MTPVRACRRTIPGWVLAACWAGLAATAATAQTGPASAQTQPASAPASRQAGPTSAPASQPLLPATRPVLTHEEELQRLEVQQARLALEQARATMKKTLTELDDVRKLFELRLEALETLNRAERTYEEAVLSFRQAEIELQKKKLEFLKNAMLLVVVDARKSPRAGEEYAAVVLRNESDMGKARIVMQEEGGPAQEPPPSLLKLDNVLVSLVEGGVIIGDPYQRIVRELPLGQQVELEFRLLKKDIEHVTVALEFLGVRKDYDVFLKIDSRQDLPEVTSAQYSQIGQLGTTVAYNLNLKRLGKTEDVFALAVLGLPRDVLCRFRSTAGGAGASEAMLTEVHFNEQITKQSVNLEVSIPEKLDPNLVDVAIPFTFLVMPVEERKKLAALSTQYGREIPPAELANLRAASLPLTLTPCGVGRLEIVAPNLFTEVLQGQPVEIKFNVVNAGTLILRTVKPELDLPLEWEGRLEPAQVAELPGGEKALFKAQITPPAGAAVGEYSIRVEAEGHSGMEAVHAEKKDFTVRIAAKGHLTGTIALVAVLVVLVVGIAIASIRISRR